MSKKKNTKAVQSRAVDINQLPKAQSRPEQYLDFLCGRAVDINALPKPQSRIEEFLEYLCHNIGNIGGGGGQPFNGVTNVQYNAQTKQLVVTYSNNLIDTFNLSNLSDVTDVQYNDNTHIMTVTRNGVATQIDLSKLNTKINNVAPVNGNIQLALNQAGDDISLTVGGQNAGTVSLNGYVKTVNNQPNQGGNVTVDAEHINYNDAQIGLGGTTVQDAIQKINEKFVSDIEFEDTTRTLKKTINGVQADVVSGLVRVWKDLDYVEQYPYINVLDLAKRQQGKQYGNNGQVVTTTSNWYIVEVDVEENTEYTLLKMHNYNGFNKVVFFNADGGYNSEDTAPMPSLNGWHRKTVRTPQGVTKVGLQLQYGIPQLPRANETMFLRGNVTENINPFIPYADGNLIQVLKDISLEFDNSNSNLKSTTVESAIKEVNSRFTTTVKSVNGQLPDGLGNVTVDASQINTVNGGSVENELSELSIRKADKYIPTFMTDVTVDDIKLTNRPIKTALATGQSGLAGTKTLAGNTDASVPQDTKVSLIRVGLQDYLEGETVTGVEVYAVNKADNTIVERIVYEGTGVAGKPKGFESSDVLYVDVEVNKSFSVEVYFIARLRQNGSKGMKLFGTLGTGIAFDKATDDAELAVGTAINDVSSRVPNILVYGETSLSNAIVNATLNSTNGIDFTKANGTTITVDIPNVGGGTVTSVNGQAPNQQGEVTVEIADIPDLQTELDKMVKTVNNHHPVGGNFNFDLQETTDSVKLRVDGQEISEVRFATAQDILTLKDLLVFR